MESIVIVSGVMALILLPLWYWARHNRIKEETKQKAAKYRADEMRMEAEVERTFARARERAQILDGIRSNSFPSMPHARQASSSAETRREIERDLQIAAEYEVERQRRNAEYASPQVVWSNPISTYSSNDSRSSSCSSSSSSYDSGSSSSSACDSGSSSSSD